MPQVVTAKDGSIKLPQELLRRWRIPQDTEWWLDRREASLILLPRLPDLRKLYVEPTTVCNLECRTCIRNAWQDPQAHMEMQTFRQIMEQTRELPDLQRVVWCGIFTFPPAPTVSCEQVATYGSETRAAGAGIHPAPIAFGLKILSAVHNVRNLVFSDENLR